MNWYYGEAIKCPNCGSEKCQEVTKEKWICLACDNVFLIHNLSKEFKKTDKHLTEVHQDLKECAEYGKKDIEESIVFEGDAYTDIVDEAIGTLNAIQRGKEKALIKAMIPVIPFGIAVLILVSYIIAADWLGKIIGVVVIGGFLKFAGKRVINRIRLAREERSELTDTLNTYDADASERMDEAERVIKYYCTDLDNYQLVLEELSDKEQFVENFINNDPLAQIADYEEPDDTMWVKVEGRDIRLVHTDIQRISQLQGRYVVEWKLHPCGGEYYYFNGSRAYMPSQCSLRQLGRNGEEETIWGHLYATRRFYCFDNVCTIPLTYEPIQFCDLEGSLVYSLEEQKIEFVVEFADNFKEQPGEQAGGQVKEQSKGTGITLAEFRRNAPEAAGLRESLLSYRKSLENMWDYNAYVGILLGVGGSKHGDAACSNYAIGQGDNGNNTKRTLEAKGLTEVFEKYKGKRIDETILLSDVEDEIVVMAPEYKKIRKNFHEVMEGRIYG